MQLEEGKKQTLPPKQTIQTRCCYVFGQTDTRESTGIHKPASPQYTNLHQLQYPWEDTVDKVEVQDIATF